MTDHHPTPLEGLHSTGPHPDHAGALMLFGQFVGSWDLDVTWHEQSRAKRRERGEWHFGWILEGRGVQDVWIVPRRSERARHADLYEYGSTIRFYDPKIDAWHSTWHGPMHGVVRKFIARAAGDTIVLDGEDSLLRWTFRDITADRFLWTNEVLGDDGATWHLQQDFVCRRA